MSEPLDFERDAQAEESARRNIKKFTCDICGKDFREVAESFPDYWTELMLYHVRVHANEAHEGALIKAGDLVSALAAQMPELTKHQIDTFDELKDAMEELTTQGFWTPNDPVPVEADNVEAG